MLGLRAKCCARSVEWDSRRTGSGFLRGEMRVSIRMLTYQPSMLSQWLRVSIQLSIRPHYTCAQNVARGEKLGNAWAA